MRAEEEMDGIQEQEEEFELRERKRWLFFGLPFTFTTYRLTNKKLTMVSGLLTTVEEDILLYRIMDTSLRRSLFQKLFGLGCIRWRPPITAILNWRSTTFATPRSSRKPSMPRWSTNAYECVFAPANIWGRTWMATVSRICRISDGF